MRLCLVPSLGLLLTACGLSMNPDLPSTEAEKSPPFGGDSGGPVSNGDGDSGIGIDGEGLLPIFESPAGAGGAASACLGPGGEGGADNCQEARWGGEAFGLFS